jgi:transketolase
MFRAVLSSVVLYPCDAVSTEKLVEAAARNHGIVYLRTTRKATPIIYDPEEKFVIGGSKILRSSDEDQATVITAGVTVFEALTACEELQKEGISLRVIDLYSIKPLDLATLLDAARVTKVLVTVEDHYPEGGLGEAVLSALASSPYPVHCLAVRRKPKSGKPEELLDYEEISAGAIIRKVKELI